jgi:hypothetical protein
MVWRHFSDAELVRGPLSGSRSYGAGGVMLAGYQNGNVSWRALLADDCDPDLSRKERDLIISMRDFAAARGELVKPPPELRPDSITEIKYPFAN